MKTQLPLPDRDLGKKEPFSKGLKLPCLGRLTRLALNVCWQAECHKFRRLVANVAGALADFFGRKLQCLTVMVPENYPLVPDVGDLWPNQPIRDRLVDRFSGR